MHFNKLHEDASIPMYQTEGSAGLDLQSVEQVILKAGERKIVRTGLQFIGEHGYELQIRPRSGLAAKHGITIVNSPGTVDSDYEGELMVILLNTGNEDFTINKGDRIAQAVICPVYIIKSLVLNNTRGNNGLGSTGQ